MHETTPSYVEDGDFDNRLLREGYTLPSLEELRRSSVSTAFDSNNEIPSLELHTEFDVSDINEAILQFQRQQQLEDEEDNDEPNNKQNASALEPDEESLHPAQPKRAGRKLQIQRDNNSCNNRLKTQSRQTPPNTRNNSKKLTTIGMHDNTSTSSSSSSKKKPKFEELGGDVEEGTSVWAHITGYPHWPAKVSKINGEKFLVFFYGSEETEKWAWVAKKDCSQFDFDSAEQVLTQFRGVDPYTLKKDRRMLKEAVEEALKDLIMSSKRENEDACYVCGRGGFLLLCDGQGCSNACHCECAGLETVPEGTWYCDDCSKTTRKSSRKQSSKKKDLSVSIPGKSSNSSSSNSSTTSSKDNDLKTSPVSSRSRSLRSFAWLSSIFHWGRDTNTLSRILQRDYWKTLSNGTQPDFTEFKREATHEGKRRTTNNSLSRSKRKRGKNMDNDDEPASKRSRKGRSSGSSNKDDDNEDEVITDSTITIIKGPFKEELQADLKVIAGQSTAEAEEKKLSKVLQSQSRKIVIPRTRTKPYTSSFYSTQSRSSTATTPEITLLTPSLEPTSSAPPPLIHIRKPAPARPAPSPSPVVNKEKTFVTPSPTPPSQTIKSPAKSPAKSTSVAPPTPPSVQPHITSPQPVPASPKRTLTTPAKPTAPTMNAPKFTFEALPAKALPKLSMDMYLHKIKPSSSYANSMMLAYMAKQYSKRERLAESSSFIYLYYRLKGEQEKDFRLIKFKSEINNKDTHFSTQQDVTIPGKKIKRLVLIDAIGTVPFMGTSTEIRYYDKEGDGWVLIEDADNVPIRNNMIDLLVVG